MEIIQSPTVPRLQQNLWLDSTNNTLNAPTKDGWKSITSSAGGGGGMTEVTHDELVSLRNEGKLTPGALYRITDYVATTTQQGTKSANHPFDIVVVALDEKTLSEDAGAIAHSEKDITKYNSVTYAYLQMDPTGSYVVEVEETAPFLMEASIGVNGQYMPCVIFSDNIEYWAFYATEHPEVLYIHVKISDFEKTEAGYVFIGQDIPEPAVRYTVDSGYFANSNLPAWQLKYCLDNDTNWFYWGQKEIPATEGVPFSLMTNSRFNWDASGSRVSYGTAIFTRYQEGDPAFAPGYYAWGVVANSKDRPFTAPGIDYTNIDTRFGFYYTESEHPTVSDVFYFKVWGQDKLKPLGEELFEYTTEGQPEGKGVIYWMKDERNNEATFDFKGITFSLQSMTSSGYSEGLYDFVNNNTPLNIEESDYQVYWLTILPNSSGDVIEDMSTSSYCCYENVNKKCSNGFTELMLPSMTLSLPKNLMLCYDYSGGGNPVTCIDNSFGENCGNNIVAPTPIGIKLLGANVGNGVFAVNSHGMYATIYPVLSGESIFINNNNMHVGRDSNGDVQIWNPADTAPQTP